MEKHKFLAKKANKQRFLNILSEHLQQHNIEVKFAEDYADVLIVKVAIELAENGGLVFVISQDTDIVILLCHYVNEFYEPYSS